MEEQADKAKLIELMADIVSAYVSSNYVQQAELPVLIGEVHRTLAAAVMMTSAEPAGPEQRKATPQEVKRSVTADHLISFEDGKRYKTLRRHLTVRGLTPKAYFEKWGLPADYPMAAPNYSKQRSELARALGLGQKRSEGVAKASSPDAVRAEAFEEAPESATDDVSRAEAPRAGAEPKGAAPARAKKPAGKATPAADPVRAKDKPKRAEALAAKRRMKEPTAA